MFSFFNNLWQQSKQPQQQQQQSQNPPPPQFQQPPPPQSHHHSQQKNYIIYGVPQFQPNNGHPQNTKAVGAPAPKSHNCQQDSNSSGYPQARKCAGCLVNDANIGYDLCQLCFTAWDKLYERSYCARCGTEDISPQRDLCQDCYEKWKGGKFRHRNYEEVVKFGSVEEELDDLLGVNYCEPLDGKKDIDGSALWREVKDISKFGPDDICPICMCNLSGEDSEDDDDDNNANGEPSKVVRLKCKHCFHEDCIKGCLKEGPSVKCPICGNIEGRLVGNQPSGFMTIGLLRDTDLEGFPQGAGTIWVQYFIPGGVQGECHQNPGSRYNGTIRPGFFPNTEEGRKVVRLMRVAFLRRLVFTVGKSVTSGRDNQVIWNGIHHKTHTDGGAERHGYPDPTYLGRVQEELANFNIMESKLIDESTDHEEEEEEQEEEDDGKIDDKKGNNNNANDENNAGVIINNAGVIPNNSNAGIIPNNNNVNVIPKNNIISKNNIVMEFDQERSNTMTTAELFCRTCNIVINNPLFKNNSYPKGTYLPTDK